MWGFWLFCVGWSSVRLSWNEISLNIKNPNIFTNAVMGMKNEEEKHKECLCYQVFCIQKLPYILFESFSRCNETLMLNCIFVSSLDRLKIFSFSIEFQILLWNIKNNLKTFFYKTISFVTKFEYILSRQSRSYLLFLLRTSAKFRLKCQYLIVN